MGRCRSPAYITPSDDKWGLFDVPPELARSGLTSVWQDGWDASHLTRLVEGTSDRAVFFLRVDGSVAMCSLGAERMFGHSRSNWTGLSFQLAYANEDEGKASSDLKAAEHTAPLRVSRRCRRKDASEFPADLSIVAFRDAGGAVTGYGISLADVSQTVAREQALRQSELHLRSILATVPDAMIVIDDGGRMLSFSAAAERLFGYAANDVVGHNVSMLMPAPYRAQHDDFIRRYEITGERRIIGIGRVVTGLRRDGTEFPMELSVGEARDGEHRVFTGFIRDLTAQQIAALRMREMQSELIHVSRVSAMGTMASTLAHELNQPLTAIANYLEAGREMIGSDQPSLLGEAMDEAVREALRAGQIVRRLRDFVARRETDKTVNALPALIDEAARLGLLDASESGIRLFTEFDPSAGHVLADRVQIQQVLVNLFRNAAEALAASEVRDIVVTTRRAGEMVEIAVADTGRGIAPDIVPRLFEAFASDKHDGMGLGLSICRTIVEAHGGRIGVRPNVGGGTVFTFTLWSGDPADVGDE